MKPTRRVAFLAVFPLVTGCPAAEQGPDLSLSAPEASAPGGGPPAEGPGQLDLAAILPQQTQDQVRAGPHVRLAGTVDRGPCTGTIRIDVLEARPQNAEAQGGTPGGPPAGGRAPLTVLEGMTGGPFEGVLPTGRTVTLTALCDQDGDGRLAPPADYIALGGTAYPTDQDVLDVAFTLGEFPPMNGPPQVQAPPTGPASGTPEDALGPEAGGAPPLPVLPSAG